MQLLSQYRDIKREVEHIKSEIETLRTLMLSPRTAILSDSPKGPINNNEDIMANKFIKLEELIEKYESMVTSLCDEQLKIENAINDLEPIERDLIRYHYIDGLPWREVARKIGYGQKQTFRIRKEALKKLKDGTP